MGFKSGDLDIDNEIVELHFQVLRTQLLLEEIVNRNKTISVPDQKEMDDLQEKALGILKSKFPNLGIKKK